MTDDLIRIATDQIAVTVSPLGAEMQSLQDAQGRDYLWTGDPAFWSGRAPILFPIVGRAPNDQITAAGHCGQMAQHGFARRSPFTLIVQDPASCTHRLTPTQASRAIYPFDFQLDVTHRVTENTLSVTAQVSNTGTVPLPFGIGFHPAFCWPLPGAENHPHYITLDTGAAPALARLTDGLLPPERHPSPFVDGRLTLHQSQFEADAMIFPQDAGAGLIYGPDTGPHLRFAFDNLPFLALWTKPGAPFICIEPWHGMAARTTDGPAIEDRPGTITLPAGHSRNFNYQMSLHPPAT